VALSFQPNISSSGALFGILSTHGARPPTRQQLDKITTLAQQTANELVRLRAWLAPALQGR
jgi:hypothetical protein